MRRFTHTFTGALIILLVAVFFVVCVLSLAGCTSVDEGRVVVKEYSPAHSSLVPTPIFNGQTTTLVLIPQYRPERWTISVQSDAGDRDTWDIDAVFYGRVQVGDVVRRTAGGKVAIITG